MNWNTFYFHFPLQRFLPSWDWKKKKVQKKIKKTLHSRRKQANRWEILFCPQGLQNVTQTKSPSQSLRVQWSILIPMYLSVSFFCENSKIIFLTCSRLKKRKTALSRKYRRWALRSKTVNFSMIYTEKYVIVTLLLMKTSITSQCQQVSWRHLYLHNPGAWWSEVSAFCSAVNQTCSRGSSNLIRLLTLRS